MAENMRPNILFFLTDQCRSDWICNPTLGVRTPRLAELSARGVRFANALCPSPLCGPARAALATGMEYQRCGVPDNRTDFPWERPTFYKHLRDVTGYHVATVGKLDLHKKTRYWGLDGKHLLREYGFSDGCDSADKTNYIYSVEQPVDPYMADLHRQGFARIHAADMDRRKSYGDTHATPMPDELYYDNWVARAGIERLQSLPHKQPWFLMVNFPGPHKPMDVTAEMLTWYADKVFPPPHIATDESAAAEPHFLPETHQRIRRNYAAMIENIDRWVGRFLEVLQQRGELNSTWIVFSSDHGEMLGDRGLWGKSKPWQPSVGIPLIIAGPACRQGLVSQEPTSLIDLAATFLEIAGLRPPSEMDARSLLGYLSGATDAHRPFVRSELGNWQLVFDGRYKLVTGFQSQPLLFDLETDPWEERNIAADSREIVLRLEKALSCEAERQA